ncbi:lysozyme inhibitor LprI family protein [Rhizobacter sp. P5_C2]
MSHLRLLATGALLILPLCTSAEEKGPKCESSESGAELVACAAARHAAADVKLNIVYRQLRNALRKRGEVAIEENLQIAQRDWLKFQKSHCAFEATYEGAGGSFVSAKLGDCMAETTAERTKYLEDLLPYFK